MLSNCWYNSCVQEFWSQRALVKARFAFPERLSRSPSWCVHLGPFSKVSMFIGCLGRQKNDMMTPLCSMIGHQTLCTYFDPLKVLLERPNAYCDSCTSTQSRRSRGTDRNYHRDSNNNLDLYSATSWKRGFYCCRRHSRK